MAKDYSEEIKKNLRGYAFEALVTNNQTNYEKMADDFAYHASVYFANLLHKQDIESRLDMLKKVTSMEQKTENDYIVQLSDVQPLITSLEQELESCNEKITT